MKKKSKKLKKYSNGGNEPIFNNPDESYNSISNTEQNIVGQINPMYGAIHAGVSSIMKPLHARATRTDENGNLINKNMAKTQAIGQAFADPLAFLGTRASYKGGFKDLTGEKYANKLEEDAKANLPQGDVSNYIYNNTGDKQAQYNNNTGLIPQYMCSGGKIREMRIGAGYAEGGIIPNAELEKQETMRMPDGSTDEVDGPSHENGGIPVSLPPGTQIFSDRLKASTGKTFAKEAKKYDTSKFKKILEDEKKDALAKKTAELMFKKNNESLSKLFNEQESQKQEKALKAFNSFQKKYGDDLIPKDFNPENIEMKKGGWIQKAVNPAHKGYCTPMTKSTCTPHRKALAKTFKKHHGFHKKAEGGIIPEYWEGGELNLSNSTPEKDMNNYYNNIGNQQYNDYSSIADQANQLSNNQSFSQKNNQPNWNKIGTEVGIGALNNMGSLAYLIEQGKKYDKQNFYKYSPKYLDPSATLRDIENSNYAAKKSVGQLSGGNAGLAMNALLAAKLQGDKTKAQVNQDYQNANSQIFNQSQQYNIGNKYMTDDINAQNKGKALSNYYNTLNNVGGNTSKQIRDNQVYNKQENNDKMRMDLLADLYNNYNFVNGKWVYKQ